MMRIATLLLSAGALFLGGCASQLTGYDAESKLKCGVSQGTPCTPVSKVYAMTQAGTLPSQQARGGDVVAQPLSAPALRTSRPAALASGMPMRSAPRMLRIWIAPWEDNAGSLHDQQFLYVTLDAGRWLIEHNQQSIIDQYRPTTLRQGAPVDAEAKPVQPSATTKAK